MSMEKKTAGGHRGHTPSDEKGGASGGLVYHAAAVTGCQTRNSTPDLSGSTRLRRRLTSLRLNLSDQGTKQVSYSCKRGGIVPSTDTSRPSFVSVHGDTTGL